MELVSPNYLFPYLDSEFYGQGKKRGVCWGDEGTRALWEGLEADFLVEGTNEIILSLPVSATDYESAVLPQSTYVQYDALRLEIV